MLSVAFQLALAMALLAGAFLMRSSIARQRVRTFNQIMEGIRNPDYCLSGLSYGGCFSDGLDCAFDQIWTRIGGRGGIWILYRNTDVLLEAIAFLIRRDVIDEAGRKLIRLQSHGKNVKVHLGLCLVKSFVWPARQLNPSLATATALYISLISHLALAINDHDPGLLKQYEFHVNRAS